MLLELREKDTHESRTQLINLLDRLKRMFKDKYKATNGANWDNYLKQLDCEYKFSDMPYKDGPEFINLMFYTDRSIKRCAWYIKIPVHIAEKLLVLGMP